MASSTVIPPSSDVINLKPALHALNNSQRMIPSRMSTPSSATEPRRALSAQTLNGNSNLYYSRCIEFLQEQHKTTLEKLHKEVHDLKQENKKLHFKILLENDGGAMSVVKKHMPAKVIVDNRRELSDDIILKETIKDLQVKLNLANDTASHLKSTVKTLNKQLSLLKKGNQVQTVEKSKSLSTIAHEQAQLKLIQHLRQKNLQQAKQLEALKLQLQINNDQNVLQKSFEGLGDTNVNLHESPPSRLLPRESPRTVSTSVTPRESPDRSTTVSKRPSLIGRNDSFLPPLNIKSAQGMRFRPDGKYKRPGKKF